MMRVLLIVWEVSIPRKCESDGNVGVSDGGCVVAVSAVHESMGGTHGSGMVSTANDVLEMRGVGGVCDMCMGLARGWVEESVSG